MSFGKQKTVGEVRPKDYSLSPFSVSYRLMVAPEAPWERPEIVRKGPCSRKGSQCVDTGDTYARRLCMQVVVESQSN